MKKATAKPKGEWREFQIVVGIDPGMKTGFAIWDGKTLTLHEYTVWETFDWLRTFLNYPHKHKTLVILEDARKNYRPKNETDAGSDARKMGAGWIRSLSSLYEHFLQSTQAHYITKRKGVTKLDAVQFHKITGIETRIGEHNARDAGMMVYQHPLKVFV